MTNFKILDAKTRRYICGFASAASAIEAAKMVNVAAGYVKVIASAR